MFMDNIILTLFYFLEYIVFFGKTILFFELNYEICTGEGINLIITNHRNVISRNSDDEETRY